MIERSDLLRHSSRSFNHQIVTLLRQRVDNFAQNRFKQGSRLLRSDQDKTVRVLPVHVPNLNLLACISIEQIHLVTGTRLKLTPPTE